MSGVAAKLEGYEPVATAFMTRFEVCLSLCRFDFHTEVAGCGCAGNLRPCARYVHTNSPLAELDYMH